MSTQRLAEFVRTRRTALVISAAAFLFGSASFLAGYITASEYRQTPIIIEQCASTS